ncbi:MAG TPA: hypothetical protein VFN67_14375 [Polyangiales bacterium]|nr:hypothetical protein [Polyangiales bacterium]
MTLRDDLSALNCLAPWVQLEPVQARAFEQTLSNSLAEQHPLHGRSAQAFAKRTDDAEEVLFLVDSPEQLCVVNLESARKHSADRPFFVAYASVEEFEQGCMLPDHLEYTDEDV